MSTTSRTIISPDTRCAAIIQIFNTKLYLDCKTDHVNTVAQGKLITPTGDPAYFLRSLCKRVDPREQASCQQLISILEKALQQDIFPLSFTSPLADLHDQCLNIQDPNTQAVCTRQVAMLQIYFPHLTVIPQEKHATEHPLLEPQVPTSPSSLGECDQKSADSEIC